MVTECLNGKQKFNKNKFNIIKYIKGINNIISLFRSDGRKYKGEWKFGVKNGNGEFYDPNLKGWKKGIWSDGRRVQWEWDTSSSSS